MGEMLYCPNCKENRYAEVKINWVIAVILLILGIVLGLIYIVYCYVEKKQCPVCGTNAKLMEVPHLGSQGNGGN